MTEVNIQNNFKEGPKLKVTKKWSLIAHYIHLGKIRTFNIKSGSDRLKIKLHKKANCDQYPITCKANVLCSLKVPGVPDSIPPDFPINAKPIIVIAGVDYYNNCIWYIAPSSDDPRKKRDGWKLTVRTSQGGEGDEKDDVSIGPPPEGGQNEDNQAGANH